MNLLIALPLAFSFFVSVLAHPATADPAKDVDFHMFPEFAGLENLDQLAGNSTEVDDDIEARSPASAAANQFTLKVLKKIMFDYSMSQFQSARNAKSPSCFDWYSNACTLSPDRPLNFNFIPSCQRHDFGDTNFGKKDQWNPVNKARTDWRFRTDMLDECAKYTGLSKLAKRVLCTVLANKYADAVVLFNPATDL